MIPAPRSKYLMIVLGVTTGVTALALLAQVVPQEMAMALMLPAMLPMVCSLPLAAGLPSAAAFPGWLASFVLIAVSLDALVFLPVKFRTKFPSRAAFLATRATTVAAYALATVPCLRLFGEWMSV